MMETEGQRKRRLKSKTRCFEEEIAAKPSAYQSLTNSSAISSKKRAFSENFLSAPRAG